MDTPFNNIYTVGVSGTITVTDVEVEGCNGSPCQLKKGTNASVAISYTLSELRLSIGLFHLIAVHPRVWMRGEEKFSP